MCNLYAMKRSVDEMLRLFADLSPVDLLGNLPAMPEVYPDYSAPILRSGEAGPELAMRAGDCRHRLNSWLARRPIAG